MRSRKTKSINPPLPAPAGPLAQPLTYHERVLQEILDDHERATGVRIDVDLLRDSAVAAELEWPARRERRKARVREARAAGRRSLIVCGRWTGKARIPDLRMSGWWLRAAGFDLGQAYEVEVQAGKLTIRAVP
jgi:type I toxin-antitoxin system toxin SymE